MRCDLCADCADLIPRRDQSINHVQQCGRNVIDLCIYNFRFCWTLNLITCSPVWRYCLVPVSLTLSSVRRHCALADYTFLELLLRNILPKSLHLERRMTTVTLPEPRLRSCSVAAMSASRVLSYGSTMLMRSIVMRWIARTKSDFVRGYKVSEIIYCSICYLKTTSMGACSPLLNNVPEQIGGSYNWVSPSYLTEVADTGLEIRL